MLPWQCCDGSGAPWMAVRVYEKGKMNGATQLQVLIGTMMGVFEMDIIGRDRKCTLWCILRHFSWRRYLPQSCIFSSPRTRLIFSSRPSDKTSSSLKAYKRTDASDAQRSVSLKLDWPQLLYLVAVEQTHTHAHRHEKKKRSFLKAGPRGPERQMGLRGEMERNEWSLF